ncbi:MAG: hypothetical protein DRP61_03195 [Candidatus Omnitrophota bacterium]|nr:MAG: hypothetical protein DRP61_03195 [Candidatus Omnitrophota bacterium]
MIAEVLVGLEINKSFDYEFRKGSPLKKGMRVLVDFSGKKRVGFVVKIKKSSSQRKLKPVLRVLDNLPAFTPNLLKFSQKVSQIYLYSQGEILEMMLPESLRRKKFLNIEPEKATPQKEYRDNKFIYLRENLTANTRFFYYKEIIQSQIGEKRKVIICVPQKEDAFFIKDFLEKELKGIKIALLFGSDKPSSQLKEWLKIRNQQADVSIGTRFAIFSPFENLGAIIVEKENFFGYFQPEKPFYHLRDLAFLRAKVEKSNLILHSDYPSLKLYRLLEKKKLIFVDKFKESQSRTKIFDLAGYKFKRTPLFSELSLEIIRSDLEKGRRVVVFWNRKGFSNILRCNFCKEIIKCPQCGNFLSFSLEKNYFCRYCGYKDKGEKIHKCSERYIRKIGTGIERVELTLKRFFPAKKIFKFTNRLSFSQDWDILISTQKLVFLKELPSAEVVILAGIDSLLSWGDFNSSLELYYLLQRLKSIAKEELIIFTFHPSYYVFLALKKEWGWFYERELKERKTWKLPPYVCLAKLTLRAKKEKPLLKRTETLKNFLEEQALKIKKKVEIYGPLKEKLSAKKTVYSLVVKASQFTIINKVLRLALQKFKKSTAKLSIIIER